MSSLGGFVSFSSLLETILSPKLSPCSCSYIIWASRGHRSIHIHMHTYRLWKLKCGSSFTHEHYAQSQPRGFSLRSHYTHSLHCPHQLISTSCLIKHVHSLYWCVLRWCLEIGQQCANSSFILCFQSLKLKTNILSFFLPLF